MPSAVSGVVLIAGAGFSAQWGLPLGEQIMDMTRLKMANLPGKWQRDLLPPVASAWHASRSQHQGRPDKFGRLLQKGDLTLSFEDYVRFLALRFSEHHWRVGTSHETKWGTGDHIRKQKTPPDAYRLFVQALKSINLTGIVTTNYDIVFEKILGPTPNGRLGGFHYGTPGEKLKGRHPERGGHSYLAPPLAGAIPLLKLHGSLNLQLNDDGTLTHFVDCRPSRGMKYKPVLIPPGDTTPRRALNPTWQEARRLLNAASTWIICGYSLPDDDDDVRGLLSRSTEHLRRVVILDLVPAAIERELDVVLGEGREKVKYAPCSALSPNLQPGKLRALISAGA
jgi:hypothetical protein